VNNVLGFPYIFRGALDVRATKINEEMKLAAVHAIAELAKKPVPQKVSLVYGGENLTFGRNYIIPKPFDPRLIYEVPPAIAKAAIASGVAQKPITDWEAYKGELMDRIGVGSKEIRLLQDRAKRAPKRIVFAEADQLEVLKAAQRIYEDGIGIPVLLGNKDMIKALKYEIGFNGRVDVIDPKSDAERARREKFVKHYWKLRERRGITYEVAERLMRERNYFGTMLVETGQADAMITGYSHAYPKAIRPVLEIIKKEEGVRRVAAASIMFGKQGPLFLSDATININPTAEELANIALLTARAVKFFGLEPSVAMLSYSSFGSAVSESSLKVREAVAYLHKNHPDLVVDGEIQADFALNPDKIAKNYPFSKLNNGKAANVLIFPNLEAANISYKLLKETEHLDTIGPVILGLTKPIHVATLGSTVDEMVNLATLAVIQAQSE
jgi:NADP-dependent malic enzyme